MIAEEKIKTEGNSNTWICRRGEDGYRIVVEFEKDENVAEGEVFSRVSPKKVVNMISLCELCSDLLGIEYDDHAHYEEIQKEDAIGVLEGLMSEEDYREIYG